jgi:hypothetical protein
MTKLIGTDPNQVPSNADLGSAAFMEARDFLTAKGSSLSAIDTVISYTAKDVFVYDTSKDSDGGAWRKRTQSTSWYNEKLNTPIRGSRREFPSVAVIVATDTIATGESRLIIYDGDDPTLPMWMTLACRGVSASQGPTLLGWYTSGTPILTAVTALNGIVGVVGDGSLRQIKFVSDNFRLAYTTNSYYTANNIAQREIKNVINEGSNGTRGDIVGWYATNDLDMTILPNAPIDVDTGLPTPSIVLATDDGISVIKDDGVVIARAAAETPSNYAHSVMWDGDHYIYGEDHSSNGHASSVRRAGYDITSGLGGIHYERDQYLSNLNWAKFKSQSYAHDSTAEDYGTAIATENTYFRLAKGGNVGSNAGITKVLSPILDSGKMPSGPPHTYCYITHKFNTGWMGGSIRLATCADTIIESEASPSIPDLVNGITAGSTYASASGAITTGITSSSASNIMFTVPITMTTGKQYTISMQREAGSNSFTRVYGPWSLQHAIDEQFQTTGSVVTHTFTASSNASSINFVGSGANSYMKASFLEVREGVADRSWYHDGLEVHGTVKREVVAPGAELVGYKFTGDYNNYLFQPYLAHMYPDTGEVTISVWVKRASSSSLRYVILRGTADATETYRLGMRNDAIYWDYGNGAAYTQVAMSVPTDEWFHLLVTVKEGEAGQVWVNGQEMNGLYSINNVAPNPLMNSTSYTTLVGRHYDNDNQYAFDGHIALLRVCGTRTSHNQITKMYNDEKQLFKPDAKATIYGSNAVINSLAYDESTGLLHAGTPSGRSVFKDLCRIDNTTDPINVSLSAANGLVAEE